MKKIRTTTTTTTKSSWNSTTTTTTTSIPTLNIGVTIQLNYFSNFWIFLDLPLIKCEIELDLTWTNDCESEHI